MCLNTQPIITSFDGKLMSINKEKIAIEKDQILFLVEMHINKKFLFFTHCSFVCVGKRKHTIAVLLGVTAFDVFKRVQLLCAFVCVYVRTQRAV